MDKYDREEVDTLIFSDLHLISKLSKAKALNKASRRYRARRIVANGDILDGTDFTPKTRTPMRSRKIGEEGPPPRMPRSHLDFMEEINGLAKHGCEVWYIPGNHDHPFWFVLRAFASFMGASICDEELQWEYRGKKFLAIHGDQFDTFYHEHKWVSEIATRIYEMMQHVGRHADWLCSFAKRRSKHYTRAIDCVAEGATHHAAHQGVHHVFCGHTHHPEYRFLNGVHYYNSGSWTASGIGDDLCSFITIGKKGIRIHYFDNDGKEVKVDGPYPI